MRRIALIASILLLAPGCDKTSTDDSQGASISTDLAGANVLFQVFGPRDAPRIAPIALIRGGVLSPITLTEREWQDFDSVYFAVGTRIPIYRFSAQVGELEVTRRMWPADGPPLYEVPGCREIVPQAMGRLLSTAPLEESVELLAMSVAVAQSTDTRPFPRQADADSKGRSLANAVAAGAQIGPEDLAALDFHARWIRTGVGANGRSLLASYIDANAGDLGPGAGNTSVILTVAEEDSGSVMRTSYLHALSGEARTVEFQRLLNFADLDGDGVSELVLEAWRYAGIPSLAVLSYREGRWTETFRVGLDWCIGAVR